jgi:membrane-associated phospholipid phosphatase
LASFKVQLNIAGNLYWIMVFGYVVLLIATYLRYGILFQFSLGLYSLVALPIVFILGKSREFVKNWTPFLVLLLSYEALQGVAGILAQSGNIVSLYGYDTALWGFNFTGAVQSALLSPMLTSIASFLYALHFPLIITAAIFLWYTDRKNYNKYVYSIILTSYLALATFILFPSAPPWYTGAAMNAFGNSTGPGGPLVSWLAQITKLIESDKYAAFPSLHGAYVLLFCFFMTRSKRKLGYVAIPITIGVLFSTIYLGQHYLIDLLAGALYAFGSVSVIEFASRKKFAERFFKREELIIPNAQIESLKDGKVSTHTLNHSELSGNRSTCLETFHYQTMIFPVNLR